MNRKERRAKGVKNTDPTFTLKRSDLKSHIDRLIQSEEIQKAIQEEAHRANLRVAKQQDLDILTLILMSLHRREKFGRKRLLRFCYTFDELQKYYEGFYEDCDLFAMRVHLRDEVGINVERIQEEVAKFLDENPNERQS